VEVVSYCIVERVSKNVLVFKKMFCPVHRRYADFVMKPSDDPYNPNLFCPIDGFRIGYLEAAGRT
jgi:hypothetical protein